MTIRQWSIAPMMAYTDRHFRWLMRRLCPSIYLYTEMITANALCFGDVAKHCEFDASESPVAIQLAGCEADMMAKAAQLAASFGYVEMNINAGCPSPRVQRGQFGACLFAMPERVAACVEAMRLAVDLPITVKTRIGVDECDDYEDLVRFARLMQEAGAASLQVHARKAWLSGLNPAQNRSVPPLNYERVYRLKQDFPDLEIIINGGIRTLPDIQTHLIHVDGVMLGRIAYEQPLALWRWSGALGHKMPDIQSVLFDYFTYCRVQHRCGGNKTRLVRPLHGWFHGMPYARRWRQSLARWVSKDFADTSELDDAVDQMLSILAN